MAWLYGSAEREQNIEAIDMAIEALSAPSGDLISRADAMTEFREWVKRANENGETPTWNDAVSLIGSLPSAEAIPTVIRAKTFMRKEDFDKWADDIKKQNKSQAEAVQGWISCSERLPDIDTSVIICTASGNITDGYRWNEKDWFLAWSEYNGWHEGNDEGRITAWMPLPKPYKRR